MKFSEVINSAPDNLNIFDAITKCYTEVTRHDNIVASISGGSDSDEMLDMIIRCGGRYKTKFVFFNTGLEYDATKKQIKYLDKKYGIKIEIVPPVKPIPVCVREYGVPFWSKQVSEMIERLQKHNFKWEDEPIEQLLVKYPKCKAAIRWWCNDFGKDGKITPYDIGYVRYLKEFLIQNPPTFKISNKCCHYAKKLPAKRFKESVECDLNCVGIRKSEGGARSTRYSSCFTSTMGGVDEFRPLFWLTDADKKVYDQHYNIRHSDCYELWGMKRTGCAGCPFSRNFEEELELAKTYEPKFYKAMINIFSKSYEYRRKFEAFRKTLKE
jgi:3'-phosphoadenosine 5'-phosphosulfate sulfotransferase (PAPS reductase)/FAD synthetase